MKNVKSIADNVGIDWDAVARSWNTSSKIIMALNAVLAIVAALLCRGVA